MIHRIVPGSAWHLGLWRHDNYVTANSSSSSSSLALCLTWPFTGWAHKFLLASSEPARNRFGQPATIQKIALHPHRPRQITPVGASSLLFSFR